MVTLMIRVQKLVITYDFEAVFHVRLDTNDTVCIKMLS